MRNKRIQNKICGMAQCKFTPNLKSLTARFLSKIAHHVLLNLCFFFLNVLVLFVT